MNTATEVTEWSLSYTDDEGVEHTKWFPLDLNYGGSATLWRLEPPLDGEDHVLIVDRGAMLQETGVQEALALLPGDDAGVPTEIPYLIEVFRARPDGSVESMDAIAKPVSLRRPSDGIDIDAVLRSLGYSRAA